MVSIDRSHASSSARLKTVFLSLGSNLGNREENLQRALEFLESEGIQIVHRSSLYKTEPQDMTAQPWFLNMVAEVATPAFPMQLLAALQRAERALGRNRGSSVPKGPRRIDIDILLFGQAVMHTARLTIPHPRMCDRRFVLEPLLEIAPDTRHPVTKQPLSRFLPSVATQKIRKV